MHSVTSNAVAEKLDSFLIVIDSNAISTSVSGGQAFNNNFNFTVPNGYKALCMAGFDVSGAGGAVNLYSWYAFDVYGKTGSFSQKFYFKNYTSIDFNAITLKIQLLCMKV